MTGTLATLATRFRKLADDIPKKANDRTKQCAIAVLDDLTWNTPVDVSTALSNWQVGIGSPVSGEVPAHIPGFMGSTRGASVRANIELGRRRIEARQPGQPIYLSNLLPYIRPLNDGHSSQQAAGFVQRAVMVGRLFLRGIRIL